MNEMTEQYAYLFVNRRYKNEEINIINEWNMV